MDNKFAEQGRIGRFIGSSDSSLNVCFTLAFLGFIAIFIILIFRPELQSIIDGLLAFISAIVGYFMGKKL